MYSILSLQTSNYFDIFKFSKYSSKTRNKNILTRVSNLLEFIVVCFVCLELLCTNLYCGLVMSSFTESNPFNQTYQPRICNHNREIFALRILISGIIWSKFFLFLIFSHSFLLSFWFGNLLRVKLGHFHLLLKSLNLRRQTITQFMQLIFLQAFGLDLLDIWSYNIRLASSLG